MSRSRAVALAVTTAAACIVALPALADDTTRPPDPENYRHVWITNTRCHREWSAGPCFWDAGWQGTGGGHSFWVSADQCVYYLDPTVGDYCPPKGQTGPR